MATTYAIISLGGKQYRVREGERLLVDRLQADEGKTFHPDVLFLGGDGEGESQYLQCMVYVFLVHLSHGPSLTKPMQACQSANRMLNNAG